MAATAFDERNSFSFRFLVVAFFFPNLPVSDCMGEGPISPGKALISI